MAECLHHGVMAERVRVLSDISDDHEERLRTLERGDRRVALAAGVASAAGAVLVAVITVIGMVVTR